MIGRGRGLRERLFFFLLYAFSVPFNILNYEYITYSLKLNENVTRIRLHLKIKIKVVIFICCQGSFLLKKFLKHLL